MFFSMLCFASPAFAATNTDAFSLANWLGVEPSLTAGTFFGIIAASFIYLLSTWLAIRDRSQVYLMLMVLCLMLHLAAASGYMDRLNKNEFTILFIKQSTLILFYLFSSLFTIIYLELDALRSPVRYLLYLLMLALVGILVLSAIDFGFTAQIMPYVGVGTALFLLCTGIFAWFMRVNSSFAHTLAFTAVVFGSISSLPIEWTMMGLPRMASDMSAFSYALCAMLFAVVIASQFAKRQELKERELATSNERFRMAALGSNEGLYDWDLTTQQAYFSDRLRRIFGAALTNQKQILRLWLRAIHHDDRAMVRKRFFAFLRNAKETSVTLDYRISRKDRMGVKQTVWVSTSGVAVRASGGKVIRLVGSVGDITEKKRAESRLKASEIRFRSIAEAHPVPVLIATLKEGEIVYASQGSVNALGMSMDRLVGYSLDNFFTDSSARRDLMQDVEKNGGVDLRECLLQRADHSTFYAAVSARVINYERRPCAVMGINDITERKLAETKIKDQESALQQSEKLAALGGLLAGVAHELNNPLSVIVGQAVLMRESAKDEKTASRSDKIHKAGERCARIIKSFLALARRKPPERVAVSMNEVIESSIELLAFQLRTDNVELIKHLDPALPQALADADQMTQVITNLVMNAKQVLQDKDGKRSITIDSWAAKNHGDDGMVYVSVTDNGTGVPSDIIHRIFEPFFTTKPAGSGTGVGLSLCHNIVESHGGRIWVENVQDRPPDNSHVGEPQTGACFMFSLPISVKTAVAEEEAQDTQHYIIPPQKILIVDDEVELGQTLADILEEGGHSILLAEHGRKALDILDQQDVDLIISDLRMPVLDGPGLYRTLETSKPHYLSRIIFVTGDTLSIPVREFLSQYALEVIEKPYSADDVRTGIHRVLQHLQTNPTPPAQIEDRLPS
ncbi:MAG: PAS domain S-box protein [Alphaproteobacteria bacterium]|nr:PAS domain S-box protein [Alphaproteobacteria bacterium]